MIRLTIKELHVVTDMNKAMSKLSKLEDIEEKYGNLIMLFKALDGIWVKHKNKIIYISSPNIVFSQTNDFPRVPFAVIEYFPPYGDKCMLSENDYGKTWAFTKEELK